MKWKPIADEEHTKDAANYVSRHCAPGEEQIVYDVADWIVRLNIMKFDGLYQAYA